MNHATDGLLLAYHDGEIDGPAEAELRDHLAGCAQCTLELDELRYASGEFRAAMAMTDVSAPMLATRAAIAQRGRRVRTGMSGLAKAAMLLLAAAGVLTAIPGSPLRLAVESAWQQLFVQQAPGTDVTPPGTAAAPVPDVRDIRIRPVDGRIRVLIEQPLAIDVLVSLADSDVAIVERSVIGQDVAFRSGPGRVVVSGLERGSLRIVIPRSVAEATIEIDGRTYVSKQDGVLHLASPSGTTQGEQVSFRFER
jgi:anti-sigma factor RsiW